MRAGIFSGEDAALGDGAQLALVRESAEMTGRNLSAEVSTPEAYTIPADGERIASVAVLDLGVKTSTLHYLAARGFDVHVLPQDVTLEGLRALAPDAVFYSNGPGDPEASDSHVELLQGVLLAGMPFFGICFGNQLLGRALACPPTSCRSATAASTSRCWTRPPVEWRSPRTTTASRSRLPSKASSHHRPDSAEWR